MNVDAAEELPEDIRIGQLRRGVRQAINHAINRQEIVDTLYHGLTGCMGNIIWNGVIGATEENTASYEYNPEKNPPVAATGWV